MLIKMLYKQVESRLPCIGHLKKYYILLTIQASTNCCFMKPRRQHRTAERSRRGRSGARGGRLKRRGRGDGIGGARLRRLAT